MGNEEEYAPTLWERSSPQLYGLAVALMNIAFVTAGLAMLYLLYGVFSGQLANLNSLPRPDQLRILGVLDAARNIMMVGLGVGTLCVAFITYSDEAAGYGILGAAALVGIGIPALYATVNGNIDSNGVKRALSAFQAATALPAAIGLILVLRDIALRFTSAFRKKGIDQKQLAYGSEAKQERLPVRTSLFAKCWEGPYCREFIRVHCPIFIARKACWKERRGCYCEEDIVIQATQKAQGVPLQMAPEARYNFANPPTPGRPAAPVAGPSAGPAPHGNAGPTPLTGPSPLSGGTLPITIGPPSVGQEASLAEPSSVGPANKAGLGAVGSAPLPITIGEEYHPAQPHSHELTDWQKRERCRNCIIYNEHEREKYKILMPVVLIGGIALCVILSPMMREGITAGIGGVETLIRRIAFSNGPKTTFTRPPAPVEWGLVGAFSLMIVSKLLQTLEWACFKVKI